MLGRDVGETIIGDSADTRGRILELIDPEGEGSLILRNVVNL